LACLFGIPDYNDLHCSEYFNLYIFGEFGMQYVHQSDVPEHVLSQSIQTTINIAC